MTDRCEPAAALQFSPDLATFRSVKKQARRLMTIGTKQGKPWDRAATVGQVANAAKIAPDEVVRLIRKYGFLIEVDEVAEEPIENWVVWEDGE